MVKDNDDVRYSVYEIPQDVTTAGKWFDTFDTKNVVQAFIVTIIIVYIFTKVITVNLIVAIVVWIISILFTLISYGDNSDTLYKFLFLIIRTTFIKRTYRRYVLQKKRKAIKPGQNSLKAIPLNPAIVGVKTTAAKESIIHTTVSPQKPVCAKHPHRINAS